MEEGAEGRDGAKKEELTSGPEVALSNAQLVGDAGEGIV